MTVLPGNAAERLVELRNSKGLTQAQLSKRLEKAGLGFFDRSTISRAESGKTIRVNKELVEALAVFCDVTADYILGMTDIPDKKNYEITELGLSYEAARRLICREVSADAVNRLLECDGFPLLSNMISSYFSAAMTEAYEELARLFPEMRDAEGFTDSLGIELSEGEKKRMKADLFFLQDPMGLQKNIVKKQFDIVVEEMSVMTISGHKDPKPLHGGNSEMMAELRRELLKAKRKADISLLSPEEQVALIARVVARRMNLCDDEEGLFVELYKTMMRNRMDACDERLQRAQ